MLIYQRVTLFIYRLVVWNMAFIFHLLGRIIPTDELIFFRGVGIPPTRYDLTRETEDFTRWKMDEKRWWVSINWHPKFSLVGWWMLMKKGFRTWKLTFGGNLFEPFGETLLETGLLQPMVLEQGEESLLFLFAFVCVFFPLYLKCLERLC